MATNIADAVAHHVLLPHERAMVKRTLARYEANPNRHVQRLRQNYGPDGVLLLIAARASQVPASVVGVLGGLLLAVSRASGTVAIAGYALEGMCAMFGLTIVFRATQSSMAGRRYRDGRPFARR